jgi:hypothetical protein
MPVKECLKKLGQRPLAFSTYSNFFLHIDNICFYVQREAFDSSTQRAVLALYSATLDTATNLRKFSSDAQEMGTEILSGMEDRHKKLVYNLESMSDAQVSNFDALSDSALRLQRGQEKLITSASQLSSSFSESLELQSALKEEQESIHATVTRTGEEVVSLDASLSGLRKAQAESFQDTIKSIDVMVSKQMDLDTRIAAAHESMGTQTLRISLYLCQAKHDYYTTTIT